MNYYDNYCYLLYYFMKLKVTGHPTTRLIFSLEKCFQYSITIIEQLKITNYMRKVVYRGYIVKATMLNGRSLRRKP